MKLLFVCTGNTCRSPMAEALLRYELREDGSYEVESAGVYATPGLPASDFAIAVMLESSIDIASHRSRQLSDELVQAADAIVTMTDAHRRAVLRGYPGSAGRVRILSHILGADGGAETDIADPFGGDLDDYRLAAADIRRCISRLAAALREGAADFGKGISADE